MKRKNHQTQDYRTFTLTLLFSLIFSVAAFAAEKFVLSAIDGTSLILRMFELDQNQIKTVDSNVIETGNSLGIYQTAVAFRKNDSGHIFDVYYGYCHDIDCAQRTVSMKRVDSKLQLKFGQDFPIHVEGNLSTERLQKPSGLSLRLLIGKGDLGKVEERRLDKEGIPRAVSSIAVQKGSYYATATEDGKMVVAHDYRNDSQFINIRSFHPLGPIREMQTDDSVTAVTLSGPATRSSQLGGSRAGSFRFLFFRVYRDHPDTGGAAPLQSRIMKQRVDDSTGEFLGRPKAFTKFKVVPVYFVGQSVTVTPGANVVFFTEFDTSCNKNLLWAQVFDPQKRIKVGPSQLLIGCSELSNIYYGVEGIDVAQFER